MHLTKIINLAYRALVISIMSLTLLSAMPMYQSIAGTTTTGATLTAAQGGKVTEILCRASNFISGNTGKAIAVLVVISLAIALFLGKVSWGMAIAVAVGMGILFGAPGLVDAISGGGGFEATCKGITVN